uniref:Uncharacterized protein n=1 Tax=Manihot esculenta TaxID=3983 RepID=A0A2C9VBE5_MANES
MIADRIRFLLTMNHQICWRDHLFVGETIYSWVVIVGDYHQLVLQIAIAGAENPICSLLSG